MAPLFTDLTYDDSAAIIKELDRQAVPYELRDDGGMRHTVTWGDVE